MEQDEHRPLPQVEATRAHPFPLSGCSKFVVSCLYEVERSLFVCFHLRALEGFVVVVSQFVVSVAAFVYSPMKGVLQQLGEGCDGRLCTGIMSNISRLERVFHFLEVSRSACFS